jgi:hypothetical protein
LQLFGTNHPTALAQSLPVLWYDFERVICVGMAAAIFVARLWPETQVRTKMQKDLIRKRILGLEGPYADNKEVTDALDHVEVWVKGLSMGQQTLVLPQVIDLIEDEDDTVATGAVLALDFFQRPYDGQHLARVLQRRDYLLQRKPVGFQRTSEQRIFGSSAESVGVKSA